MPSRLSRSFFLQSAEQVARDLLGSILHFQPHPRKKFQVRIVETEAYVGSHDLACHASKGRTKRTEPMFSSGGIAYVYLIYGFYDMFNVVTSKEGDPQAVLIRAGECLSHPELDLSGPGKFTRELGLNRKWNTASLTSERLYFVKGKPPEKISVTPRIGVAYAKEWARKPLRFFDTYSCAVSKSPLN